MDTEVTTADAEKDTLDSVSDKKAEMSVEDMLVEINKLKSINSEVIQSRDKAKLKLREFDDASDKQVSDDLIEQEKFKELYEALNIKHEELKGTIGVEKLNTELTKALDSAGVTAVNTAMKLINRTGLELVDGKIIGIETAIDQLKADHSIVFDSQSPVPPPVVPNEGGPATGYEAELKALKGNPRSSFGDFEKIQAKYGK